MRKRKQDRKVEIEETVDRVESLDTELEEAQEAPVVETPAEADVEAEEHPALLETPEAVIQRLTEELDEEREKYLRLAAEFDNFRKRIERQRGENRHNARAEVVRSILDTIDNLARVTAVEGSETSVTDVIAGVQMVERGLIRELESAGLTKIGNVDEPFDPNDHEAVSTAMAPDEEKVNSIAAVLQVGYRFGKTLLRPARVQVYVAAPSEADSGE